MIERMAASPLMHRAVAYGDLLFFGGMTATDKTADIGGQTIQILERISALLAESGSSRENILSATIYLTDLGQKTAFNEAWTGWFDSAHLPARTVVGVNDLGPSTLAEITVVAARRS